MTDKGTTMAQPKSSTSDLKKTPDGAVQFTVHIPQIDVKPEYQKILEETVRETELKGFRKGKAPNKLVEEHIGKQKLYTSVLQHLLPGVYAKAVKELNLFPISNPRVEPVSMEEEKDWTLTVTVAEKPHINLGNYKKVVSDALASSKIWVPGKGEPATISDKNKQEKGSSKSTDEKLAKVFAALLESIQFQLPAFLLEEEVNRELSRLIEQIEKLNLTIDQYLSSLGKTSDQLRSEYTQQAERTLKLELILNEIAQDLKIQVSDQEIDSLIQSVGDEKLQESLKTPSERSGIRSTLRKRKVLDTLLHI